jgi:eukaryotic-like serine/threonine-protein kinase
MLSGDDTEVESNETQVGDPEGTSAGTHVGRFAGEPANTSSPTHNPTQLGRYVLLREIGAGAIGVVYAAYHEGLDRKLAIKLLNRQRAGRADLEARLRREAKALAKLSHPNVVQVYDVGEFDGRVFVAMEFIDGETLAAWLRRSPPLTAKLAMFAAAGRGLAAAHDAGVIHRDFKPDNVLVGNDGRPRVLDFGLARAAEGPGHDDSATRSASASASTLRPLLAAVGRDLDSSADPHNPATADPERSLALTETLTLDTPGLLVAVDPREASDPELAQTDPSQLGAELASNSLVDEVVTRDGALLGTPAYMAPEQFLGERVSPASDQFSFCVALYEAVYGQRPFAGRSPLELALSTQDGSILVPPNTAEVPPPIRRLLVRGLSPNPGDRFESMHALVAELELEPHAHEHRGRWGLGLGAALLAGLALTYLATRPEPAPVCATLDEAGAELWTPPEAAALREAFARSTLPYADAASRIATERLEDWARRWAAQRVDVCAATRVRKQFSAEVHDLRQACLDRQRRAFQVLTEQLGRGDDAVIERAVEATAALPDPARCADVNLILTGVEAPPPAQADAIAELRDQLAALDTLASMGRAADGLAEGREVVRAAAASEYRPVHAEALRVHGRLLAEAGSTREALETLEDGLDEAERCGHDELIPAITTELVSLSIYTRPDPIRGRLWARRAIAALDRIDDQGLARARGLRALGNLERLDGDNAQAETHLARALALLDELAPDHPDRAIVLNDLGNALEAQGRFDDARETFARAVREATRAFGAGHPRVAHGHYNLARLAIAEGELDDARTHRDRAAGLYLAAYGPEHRLVGSVELLAANLALVEGDVDAAEAHARRVASIYATSLAPDNVDRAEPELLLGHIAFARGQLDDALDHYRACLATQRAALGPGHIALAVTLTNLGLVHLTRGEPNPAVDHLGEALAVLAAGERVNPEELRMGRQYLGDALLARAGAGDHHRAATEFEAAFEGCGDPGPCAELAAQAARAHARHGDTQAAARWIDVARPLLGARDAAVYGDPSPVLAELDTLLR